MIEQKNSKSEQTTTSPTLFNLKDTAIFTNFFTLPEHNAYLLAFIHATLANDEVIDVTIADIIPGAIKMKGFTSKNDHIWIRIELTSNYDEQKIMCDWTQLYVNQLEEHETLDDLKPAISIVILDGAYSSYPDYHTTLTIRNESNKLLTNYFEIHTIELAKEIDYLAIDEPLALWSAFLNNPDDSKLAELAVEKLPIILEVKAALMALDTSLTKTS